MSNKGIKRIVSISLLILPEVASISNETLDEGGCVLSVVYLVPTTGLSAMLLVGIYKNNAELVGSWLILNMFKTTLLFVWVFFVTGTFWFDGYILYCTLSLPLIVLVMDSCTLAAVHRFYEDTSKRKPDSDLRTTNQV